MITEEDLLRAERDGLCDSSSLTVFQIWYAFGGYHRGLSIDEIERMSAPRLKDFLYLSSRVARIQRRQDKRRSRGNGVSVGNSPVRTEDGPCDSSL
jgi:hypothetical protein